MSISQSRQHKYFGPWNVSFLSALERAGWNVSSFAFKAGISQQAMQSYASGRTRPPVDRVGVWAAQLGLKAREKADFILLAYLAWTPEPVWARVVELECQLATAKAPTDAEVCKRLTAADDAVAGLVELLRETRALFFDRSATGDFDTLRTRRNNLGSAALAAINAHSRLPGIADMATTAAAKG